MGLLLTFIQLLETDGEGIQRQKGKKKKKKRIKILAHMKKGIGEGNGTPLQYSCLENSMDGGAW